MSTALARNFTREEFLAAGDPWPPALEEKAQKMAELAQWLRDLLGAPMYVTSYYRSPARNSAVGGAEHSQHMSGEAIDFTTRISHEEIIRRVREAVAKGGAPLFGQLIVYQDTGHVHFSLPRYTGKPNYEILSAYREDGARKYTLIDRLKVVAAQVATSPAAHLGLFLVAALVLWFLFGSIGSGRVA